MKKVVILSLLVYSLCFSKTVELTTDNYTDYYVKTSFGNLYEIDYTSSGYWVIVSKGGYIRSDFHKKFEDLIYELHTMGVVLVKKSNMNKFKVKED